MESAVGTGLCVLLAARDTLLLTSDDTHGNLLVTGAEHKLLEWQVVDRSDKTWQRKKSVLKNPKRMVREAALAAGTWLVGASWTPPCCLRTSEVPDREWFSCPASTHISAVWTSVGPPPLSPSHFVLHALNRSGSEKDTPRQRVREPHSHPYGCEISVSPIPL